MISKEIIGGILIGLAIIAIIFFILIQIVVISNERIIDNNWKCLKIIGASPEWCSCLNKSYEMFNAPWRSLIPKFIFDDEDFKTRTKNLLGEYCA